SDAAGSQADAELADAGLARHTGRFLARPALAVLRAGQEVPDRAVHGARGQVAVDRVVDLDDGRQRAAAEAGDLVDGDFALGVGVLVVRDAAAQADAVDDQLRALHVAGRTDADIDRVAAGRLVAELGVEGRDARDARGRDLGGLADAAQRRLGEPVVALLD